MYSDRATDHNYYHIYSMFKSVADVQIVFDTCQITVENNLLSIKEMFTYFANYIDKVSKNKTKCLQMRYGQHLDELMVGLVVELVVDLVINLSL